MSQVSGTLDPRWHTRAMGDMRVQSGGSGEPLLLLVHGLGATSDVWNGWRSPLAERWPGRWLAPDLPGHGGSSPVDRYTFALLAESVVDLVPADPPVVVLGHSLGGVVGLALAGGDLPVAIDTVVGLGIKVIWTDAELERAEALSERPTIWFASRDEAAARYLRVAGLDGLLQPDDDAVSAGLREEGGRWRLALDPLAFAVGAPDMPGLLAASRARVVLARGERDQMVSQEQLASLHTSAVTLPGLGHNAHVEDPLRVLSLLGPP